METAGAKRFKFLNTSASFTALFFLPRAGSHEACAFARRCNRHRFLFNMENDMSSNELFQILQHLPLDVESDLARYGIEVIELQAIECEGTSAKDEPADAVAPEGCEVFELFPEEVLIHEFPLGPNWCEVVSNRHQYAKEAYRG